MFSNLTGRIILFCLVYREQTFDILFDGDEEEKSIATCVLDSILKVHMYMVDPI